MAKKISIPFVQTYESEVKVLKNKNLGCFIISKKFEKYFEFEHDCSRSGIPIFSGIEQKDTFYTGTFLLDLLNNFDLIISVLKNSTKIEDYHEQNKYIYDNLKKAKINIDLANLIYRDIDNYKSAINIEINDNQASLQRVTKDLNYYQQLLENEELYRKYYNNEIEEIKEKLKKLKDAEMIKKEKEYIEELKFEQKNPIQGKKVIREIINNLKEDRKQDEEELCSSNNRATNYKKHIEQLVDSMKEYKNYFDIYYNIKKVNLSNTKDLKYYETFFMFQPIIPKNAVITLYKKDNKYFALKDCWLNIFRNNSNSIKNNDNPFSFINDKTINFMQELKENNKFINSKYYEIYTITDILNIYLCFFIENKIYIRKCKNCGKYFIPENRSDEKYCSNIIKNNKTCKDIGAKEQHKNNMSKIKKEHEKTNQFFRNKKRLKDEKERESFEKMYIEFKNSYNKKISQYNKGTLKEKEFIDWIIKQKENAINNKK